jgi:mannosyl-3-phosphoglycerate phosphatase
MIIIFTDLDGTLLDESYSFDPAKPALKEIKRRKIPLILSTSKTRLETIRYWKSLSIREPFIIEGGCAIVIPDGYFDNLSYKVRYLEGGLLLLALTEEYQELLQSMHHLKEKFPKIRGFNDMSPAEISQETGLPLREAILAKKREFSEPFKLLNEKKDHFTKLSRIVKKMGLSLKKGGKFYHLQGKSDKGKAAKILLELFKKKNTTLLSIALGDSMSDLSLLQMVDIPVIIRRSGGECDIELRKCLPYALISSSPGPTGWNKSILEIIKSD